MKFKKQNRKIVLFLDNFSGHKTEKKFELNFFPANCTTVIQPLDKGIINSFKVKYRNNVSREKLQSLEYGSTPNEINIKDAIFKIKSAWGQVSAITVSNCFQKAGFGIYKPSETVQDEENCDFIRRYIEYQNFDLNQFAYVRIDEDTPTNDQLSDKEILSQVSQNNKNNNIIPNNESIEEEDE
ncbi:unnamed protein product [Brachionus calyciflorus]|uniref:DDE-1 domain-containing protein n=1 Tax=Brachionus calyciflorus TaxID=104777 RepID=A0A814FLN3_9BILA|nr:unnamed protein product [Brachionus calyciflorus]